MTMGQIVCKTCGKRLKAPSPLPMGKRFRCPNCRQNVDVDRVAPSRAPVAAITRSTPDDEIEIDQDEPSDEQTTSSAMQWTLFGFFLVTFLGAIFMAINVSAFSVAVFLIGSIGSAAILSSWWSSIRPAISPSSSQDQPARLDDSDAQLRDRRLMDRLALASQKASLASVSPSPPTPNAAKSNTEGAGGGCLVMIAIAIGAWMFGGSEEKGSTHSNPNKGEIGYLKMGTLPDVWIPVDDAALSELNSYSNAKNEKAIVQMIAEGRVMMCPRGTKVSVVDPGFMSTTIRMMEGPYEGRRGVIANEFLHK